MRSQVITGKRWRFVGLFSAIVGKSDHEAERAVSMPTVAVPLPFTSQDVPHCFLWSRFSAFAARFSIRVFAGFFLVSFLRSFPLVIDFPPLVSAAFLVA
jgi:hypothetical protein